MSFFLELLKREFEKSITVSNLLIIVMVFWAADKFYFNMKYCLASEARQSQHTISTFVENEYRRNILLLELKPQPEWTDAEKAQYKWYKEKLDEHLKSQAGPGQ